MAKTIINKFVTNHNEVANAFDAKSEYVFGEIVICNDVNQPSLYIKNSNGENVGIHNAKIGLNDNFLAQLPDGTIVSQLDIKWNPVTQSIDVMGKDGLKVTSVKGSDIATLATELENVEVVSFDADTELPEGITEKGEYMKFTLDTNGEKSYLYAPMVSSINLISGEGIDIVKTENEYTISHIKNNFSEVADDEISYDGTKEIVTNIVVDELGHVSEVTTGKLPAIDAVNDITYEGISLKSADNIVSLDEFAKISDIPAFEESDIKIENNELVENTYVSNITSDGHTLELVKEQLPNAVISNELNENTITTSLNDGVHEVSTVKLIAGENVNFSETENGIEVTSPNVTVTNAVEGAFVSNIIEDVHGIKVTKSNLPKLSINGKEYNGTEPVEITITTADGNTTYQLVENAEQNGKKFTVRLIGSDENESNALIDLTNFLNGDDVVLGTKELAWGEEVVLATISGNTIVAKMPNKPENVSYELANGELNEKKVTVDLVANNETVSTSTIDLSSFALVNEVPVVTDGESVMKWGEKVTLATVGETTIDAELPTSPGYQLGNGVENGKKISIDLKDANGNVISTSTIDLTKYAYFDALPEITDGESMLKWGDSTTLATIGNVDINVSLPSSPVYSIDNATITSKKATLNYKDNEGQIKGSSVIDLTTFALNEDIPVVKDKASLLEWGKKVTLATVNDDISIDAELPAKPLEYNLESTTSGEKTTITLKDDKGDAHGVASIELSDYAKKGDVEQIFADIDFPDVTVTVEGEGNFVTNVEANGEHDIKITKWDGGLHKYVNETDVETYNSTLTWGELTKVATIKGKDINIALPNFNGEDFEITPITYALTTANNPSGESVKLTLVGSDGSSQSSSIDLSPYAKDTDLQNPEKHYSPSTSTTVDLKVATNDVLTYENAVVNNIITDINGHIQEIQLSKLPTSVPNSDNAKSADKLNSGTVGDINTPVYFVDGIPVAANTMSDTATTQDGHYAPTSGVTEVKGTNGTAAHGGDIKIPSLMFDNKGHLVSHSTTTVTLPADNDTKVTSAENHYTPTYSTSANTLTNTVLENGNEVVTSVERDSKGHITKVNTRPLPSNSKSADKLNSGTVGSANTPVYFKDGVPVEGNPMSDTATTQDGHYVPQTSTTTINGGGSLNWESKIDIPSLSFDDKGHLVSGTTIGVTMPSNPDTHHTTRIYVGSSGTASNSKATDPYLKVTDENTYRNQVQFKGAQNITVSSEADGVITITGPSLTDYPKRNEVTQEINDKFASNDAMLFKGTINSESLPTTFQAGWTYKVATAGTYYGVKCEVGDMIIAIKDGNSVTTSSSNFATYWTAVQANVDGVVVGPTSSVADRIAVFDGTSGKLIKDGGLAISGLAKASHEHAASDITSGTISKATGITSDATGLVKGSAVYEIIQNYQPKGDYAVSEHNHGTIKLEGDVTGSADFGNGGATITATVADNSHSHTSSNISDRITAGTSITSGATGVTTGKAVYEYAQPKGNYLISGSLDGYATEQWVKNQNYLTSASLSGYATQAWANNKFSTTGHTHSNYLTSASLSGYATEQWVKNQNYLVSANLSGYATEQWVGNNYSSTGHSHSQYLTSANLSGYATEQWVKNQNYLISANLNGYATQAWVGENYSSTGHSHSQYLTSASLSGYATEQWVKNQNYLTGITKSIVTNALDYTPASTNTTYTFTSGTRSFTVKPSDSTTTQTVSISGFLSLLGGTVSGDVTANAFFESSDERLKDFGDDINLDLDKIKALPKKYFTWKSDERDKVELGTSAQKVQELYPEIVTEREDGMLAVDYSKLSVVALKAVDVLYDENTELKKQIKELTDVVNIIKEKLGL